jgi:hypothetical protein
VVLVLVLFAGGGKVIFFSRKDIAYITRASGAERIWRELGTLERRKGNGPGAGRATRMPGEGDGGRRGGQMDGGAMK